MNVSELFLRLAELIMLGKGDNNIDMSADGYLFDICEVYLGDYDTIILGDSEQKDCNEDKGIEPTKTSNVQSIVITDQNNSSAFISGKTILLP